MPCNSDHCHPSQREAESSRILNHLHFVHTQFGVEVKANLDERGIYGDVKNLNRDTAELCAICTKLEDAPDNKFEVALSEAPDELISLIGWWKKHKRADAKKLADAAREVLIADAESKLSEEELAAFKKGLSILSADQIDALRAKFE